MKTNRTLRVVAALVATVLAVVAPTAAFADGPTSTSVGFSLTYTLTSAMSPDGSTIAWTDATGGVVLLDVETNTATTVTDAGAYFSNEANGLVFSPDGQTLYVANFVSQAGNVVVISVPQAATTGVLTSPAFDGVWTMAISPDGNTLYAAGNGNTSGIAVYDLLTDTAVLVPSVQDPYALFVSPDGSKVYNFDYDGNLDVLDTQSKTIVHSWHAPAGNYYNACMNADMTEMFAPEYGGNDLYVISLSDGSVLRSTNSLGAENGVASCAVAPDGKTVYLTDFGVGAQNAGGDPVTSPGAIYAVDPTSLARTATYSFDAVAKTITMNFFNGCAAYVGGYHGNAQVFEDPSSCHPTLPNTGINSTTKTALVALALLALAAGTVAVGTGRRRIPARS